MLYFSIPKSSPRSDEYTSPKRRVRDDDSVLGSSSDHGRIMVGLSSNRLYIGGSNSESFRCNLELKDFVAGAVFAEVGG